VPEELLARLRNTDPEWGSSLERMQLRFAADYLEIGVRSSGILHGIENIGAVSHSRNFGHLWQKLFPS
jgi:hypothetical protein